MLDGSVDRTQSDKMYVLGKVVNPSGDAEQLAYLLVLLNLRREVLLVFLMR